MAALVVAALLAGCGREDVKVYRLAKEDSSAPHQHAPPDAMSQQTLPPGHPGVDAGSATPGLHWKLPDGWQEGKASSMRAASFTAPGKDGQSADVAVIPLPPGGSDLDLVNMWRGQMQLAPTSAADAEKESESVSIGDGQGRMFDIASQEPVIDGKLRGRILVAMVNKKGMNWFFKMAGEESLVHEQKPAFLEFLKSVSFEPAAGGPLLTSAPHAMSTNVKQVPRADESGKPLWVVPPGWQEAPAGQFLIAKFVVAGDGGAQAAVNISASAGEGGGVAGNVNRWRKQLGLGELPEVEITKAVTAVDVEGGKAMFVELSGTDARTGQPAHLVGAIVPQSGQTWFYKLMGDGKIVEREKSVFTKFVQTVKYPNAP